MPNRVLNSFSSSLLLLIQCSLHSDAQSVIFRVQAGAHDRTNVPVSAPLPDALKDYRNFIGRRADNGQVIFIQRSDEGRHHLTWLIRGTLSAGTHRDYRVSGNSDELDEDPTILMLRNDDTLEARVFGKSVFQYHHNVVPSPYPNEPFYARSGQIHPVKTPNGKIVTDDFAPDHKHQHGIMFAWTNTNFEGRKTDFWNQAKKQGTVKHMKVENSGNGSVFSWFTASLAHVDISVPQNPRTALDETWKVRVYGIKSPYLFDIESRQTCATKAPLQINKHHYGGMAIRGSRAWTGGGVYDYLTSDGKTKTDGNHTRPRWTSIYGKIDDEWCGATVLSHPDNFRFPQPVRLHPKMPYFVFAPLVLGPFKIEPGSEYVSRYRYLIHDGKPDAKSTNALWNDYAAPAKVEVLKAE